MPDESVPDTVPTDSAQGAIAYLSELQPDLRGAALLTADGEVLSEDPAGRAWTTPVRRLLEQAGVTRDEEAVDLHVATPIGEVFAVREAGRIVVVVADRFVLASLLTFDMRMALRRTEGGGRSAA